MRTCVSDSSFRRTPSRHKSRTSQTSQERAFSGVSEPNILHHLRPDRVCVCVFPPQLSDPRLRRQRSRQREVRQAPQVRAEPHRSCTDNPPQAVLVSSVPVTFAPALVGRVFLSFWSETFLHCSLDLIKAKWTHMERKSPK